MNDPKHNSRGHKQLLKAVLSGGTAVVALAATPALAQQGNSGEIIVTANRTQSELSKTPIAVTAISGEQLRDAGITNPTELQDRSANVSIIKQLNGLQITIRGVSSNDNTEKGDPSAAFLLDGIYIARPEAQNVSFFDIDRVEVLRGPQGTLYGRNTTAGVVNVLSKRPSQEREGSVNLEYGNYNSIIASVVGNMPVSETFALRAALNYDRRDSYITRPASAFDNDPAVENFSGRLSALWDITPDVDLLVRGDYSTIKGSGRDEVPIDNVYAFPLAVPPAGAKGDDPAYIGGDSKQMRTVAYADATASENDDSTWGINAELNWRFNNGFTFTYLGSHRQFDRDEESDFMFGRVAGPPVAIYIHPPRRFDAGYKQDSHEARIAYQSDRFNGQAGLYYFKENSNVFLRFTGAQAPLPGQDGYIFGFPQTDVNEETKAAFAQGTFSVTDDFRLTAGVRYTEDQKSRLGATIYHTADNEPLNFTFDAVTNPRPDELSNASLDGSRTTWKVGGEYDVGEKTLIYGSVSTGYKAGGFNDGCSAGQANCVTPTPDDRLYYQPETLTAYEVGLKTRVLDDTLRLFANYYHYDYKNLQLSSLVAALLVTNNAAAATIDGVEVEAQIRPTTNDEFNITLGWTDARYDDYEIIPGVNFKGATLDRAPELAMTIGYAHTIPLAGGGDVTLAANSKLSTEYFQFSPVLRAQFRQPDYTQSDISATYHAPNNAWYIQAFGKNLEDNLLVSSNFISPAFPGLNSGQVTLSPPRTYGVRFGANF